MKSDHARMFRAACGVGICHYDEVSLKHTFC